MAKALPSKEQQKFQDGLITETALWFTPTASIEPALDSFRFQDSSLAFLEITTVATMILRTSFRDIYCFGVGVELFGC